MWQRTKVFVEWEWEKRTKIVANYGLVTAQNFSAARKESCDPHTT